MLTALPFCRQVPGAALPWKLHLASERNDVKNVFEVNGCAANMWAAITASSSTQGTHLGRKHCSVIISGARATNLEVLKETTEHEMGRFPQRSQIRNPLTYRNDQKIVPPSLSIYGSVAVSGNSGHCRTFVYFCGRTLKKEKMRPRNPCVSPERKHRFRPTGED